VEKALCDITELIKSCEMGNFVKKKYKLTEIFWRD